MADNAFNYTYSGAEQAEVEKIRSRYLPKEDNKLERLRALDAGATKTARFWAILLGVLGCLIMGSGMSFLMTELGGDSLLTTIVGLLLGMAGLLLVALAYPLYNRVLKKSRAKIAPEILRLSQELLEE